MLIAKAVAFRERSATTIYPDEHIEQVKHIIVDLAQTALEDMNNEMASHDRDGNPEIVGTGRKRAGISIFYFEEDLEKKKDMT